MRGFYNLGATCYFNASLQCLLHTPQLSNFFILHGFSGDCAFTKMYGDLVRLFWSDQLPGKPIDPGPLLKLFQKHFPRFRIGQQHDVQEAVLCIIDILERAIPEFKNLFYGKKVQETVYPGGRATRDEPFSVHIVCSHGDDLGEMIRKSTDWNVLTDFVDGKGKQHHCATTRTQFSVMPSVFMISFDKKSFVRGVYDNIEIGDLTYGLVASAVHLGIQHGGHYVAYTKHKEKWYYKDDDFVNEVSLNKDGGHYFLVYCLKSS
jgi:ubiquitin C-terminal hydrolase